MQYRYYKRRRRRLKGKPVRLFRRGLRRFVRRRCKGRGSHRGMGGGASRFSRTCMATLDDVISYFESKSKEDGADLVKDTVAARIREAVMDPS